MKHIAIIGTILILLILTAGCLDDLSSTLPPCCDGTCDGAKTSVIHSSRVYNIAESPASFYTVDSDGLLYGWGDWTGFNSPMITRHYGHNVTFSYEMVNGHRHITGIIEDHDVKPKCECNQCECTDEWVCGSANCQCVQKCCGCGE